MIKTGKSKLNNAGFTLVEVIIAAAIMALVSIPLLHALTTAVNTNAKSKEKMRATNAAENIMEDLKSMTVSEALKKYSQGAITLDSPNYPGKANAAETNAYKMSLNASIPGIDADLQEALDKGYEVEIMIDPSMYANSNDINLASFDSVSSDNAAIYNMAPGLESKVYDYFVQLNAANNTNIPDNERTVTTSKWFKERLKREIRVTIESKGTFSDDDGNLQPEVKVFLTVTYMLKEDDNKNAYNRTVIRKSDCNYVAESRLIFDNTSSHIPFTSVFLMYYPNMATDDGDIITVHNHDNVEANLYVAAQNFSYGSLTPGELKSSNSLILQIYEDEVEDKDLGGTKEPLSLRTNLISLTENEKLEKYYKRQTEDQKIKLCARISVGKPSQDPIDDGDLFADKYTNILKKKGSFNIDVNDNKIKKLKSQDLSGKTLNPVGKDNIPDRIYDLTVRVYKGYVRNGDGKLVEGDQWPVMVELTGTILE